MSTGDHSFKLEKRRYDATADTYEGPERRRTISNGEVAHLGALMTRYSTLLKMKQKNFMCEPILVVDGMQVVLPLSVGAVWIEELLQITWQELKDKGYELPTP